MLCGCVILHRITHNSIRKRVCMYVDKSLYPIWDICYYLPTLLPLSHTPSLSLCLSVSTSLCLFFSLPLNQPSVSIALFAPCLATAYPLTPSPPLLHVWLDKTVSSPCGWRAVVYTLKYTRGGGVSPCVSTATPPGRCTHTQLALFTFLWHTTQLVAIFYVSIYIIMTCVYVCTPGESLFPSKVFELT